MWLLLQLADAAFPAGGFAHSGGLEAASALGLAGDVVAYVTDGIWQAAHLSLPLARAAHAGELEAADARAEAAILGHVARRASRAQGRAFANACIYTLLRSGPLEAAVRAGRLHGHLAPLQGAACRALGLSVEDAETLVLHTATRGLLSAAVRLGRLGPLEAQRVQHGLAPTLEAARAAARRLTLDDVAQTAPLADLAANLHDELYSRLFQS
jgi:urease accessory protein